MRSAADRRRAAAVLAAVLLLHALAAWLLSQRAAPRAPARRAAVALRLIAAPTPPAEPSPRADTDPAAAVARRPERRREPPATAPAAPPAPTAPAAVVPEAITAVPLAPAAPPVAAAASTPASAPEPPLRLELPAGGRFARPAPRNPAFDDPRANSARPNAGERLAGALGTDETRHEEARGDGRLRVRQGRDCVDVRPARATGLDPFNASVRPPPKLVEPC